MDGSFWASRDRRTIMNTNINEEKNKMDIVPSPSSGKPVINYPGTPNQVIKRQAQELVPSLSPIKILTSEKSLFIETTFLTDIIIEDEHWNLDLVNMANIYLIDNLNPSNGLSFSGKPEEKQEREGGKGKTHFKRPTLPDVSGKQGEKRETKKTNCKKTRLPVLSERADKKLEKQVKREEKAERQKETTHFQISRSAVFLENSEEKQERGIERKQRIESENERSHFKRPRSHVFSKISEEKQEKEPERKQEVGKEKEKTHFKRPRCLVFSEKLEEKQEREEIEREEEEDGVICSICASTDGDPLDPIVFCDGCDLMVHASCYGDPLQSSIPEGDWFCCRCEKIAENPTCCLCPVKEGAMKPTIDGKWAHILCALFVPEVFFREPEEREGIDCSKVPLRRFEEGCYLCGTKNGSVIDCSEPKCGAKFHVSCALEKDLCVEYREEKRRGIVVGFCEVHTQLWKKQEETGKFKIVARGHE
ncbi:peregrin [Amborella trichopoda]|uniref:peregrin n=1 Tax=Amborella trichopoda TaxID=13333 RepID=UPI0009BE89AA|nr:peregrin [Amborella trichopoda]|eukprot:XP_020522146.1 peregrin [Amborella trichopoda]